MPTWLSLTSFGSVFLCWPSERPSRPPCLTSGLNLSFSVLSFLWYFTQWHSLGNGVHLLFPQLQYQLHGGMSLVHLVLVYPIALSGRSQLRSDFARGHLAISGVWLSQLGDEAVVTPGIKWVEARDAVQHSTVHRMVHHRESSSPNVPSVQLRESWPKHNQDTSCKYLGQE